MNQLCPRPRLEIFSEGCPQDCVSTPKREISTQRMLTPLRPIFLCSEKLRSFVEGLRILLDNSLATVAVSSKIIAKIQMPIARHIRMSMPDPTHIYFHVLDVEKRKSPYLRFGKRKSPMMRFGRPDELNEQKRKSTYLRLGKK